MKSDRHDQPASPAPATPPPVSRVRPGGFFRAAVIGAVPALVPAAGCFESEPVYGVPADAADASDDGTGDGAGEDAAVEDASTDWPLPPYGVPDYGAPAYGVP